MNDPIKKLRKLLQRRGQSLNQLTSQAIVKIASNDPDGPERNGPIKIFLEAMNPYLEQIRNTTRRHFLKQTFAGLGGVALGSLINPTGLMPSPWIP